jgi:hypothetical protein
MVKALVDIAKRSDGDSAVSFGRLDALAVVRMLFVSHRVVLI